jgi:hypothetical protein
MVAGDIRVKSIHIILQEVASMKRCRAPLER